MKTFEQRALELYSGMSEFSKKMLPTGLITLLIDICKTLDKLTKDNS